jgi:hypothetical protein
MSPSSSAPPAPPPPPAAHRSSGCRQALAEGALKPMGIPVVSRSRSVDISSSSDKRYMRRRLRQPGSDPCTSPPTNQYSIRILIQFVFPPLQIIKCQIRECGLGPDRIDNMTCTWILLWGHSLLRLSQKNRRNNHAVVQWQEIGTVGIGG